MHPQHIMHVRNCGVYTQTHTQTLTAPETMRGSERSRSTSWEVFLSSPLLSLLVWRRRGLWVERQGGCDQLSGSSSCEQQGRRSQRQEDLIGPLSLFRSPIRMLWFYPCFLLTLSLVQYVHFSLFLSIVFPPFLCPFLAFRHVLCTIPVLLLESQEWVKERQAGRQITGPYASCWNKATYKYSQFDISWTAFCRVS